MEQANWSSHKSMKDYNGAISRLERDTRIIAGNKKAIENFANLCLAQGYSNLRLVKILYCMRYLGAWIGKPFEQATKEDIIRVVSLIERMNYAENSKYDFKVILKMFYRWLKGTDDENPQETKWLKPRKNNSSHKLPEDLLTEEEVNQMASAADHPRDKAFVLILYETGCRIGEILSVALKNITFDEYGAILKVRGKTGDRRVRIISSASALTSWLEIHPARNDPEAALWPPRATNYHEFDHPAEYRTFFELLRQLALKAKIKKRVYPHLFRHSRATFLASRLTEAQMKDYLGWTQGSKMTSTYVHLSGRDVDNTLIQMYGKTIAQKDMAKQSIAVKTCPRCKENNTPINRYCYKCGMPL